MPGTLVITTLSDGTNSTSATNPIRGSAKAWAQYNGTNGTIRGSYNVSSITYNTTGETTVNFTNAFANTSYAMAGSGSAASTASGTRIIMMADSFIATGSCRIYSVYSAVTPADSLYLSVAFFQ